MNLNNLIIFRYEERMRLFVNCIHVIKKILNFLFLSYCAYNFINLLFCLLKLFEQSNNLKLKAEWHQSKFAYRIFEVKCTVLNKRSAQIKDKKNDLKVLKGREIF